VTDELDFSGAVGGDYLEHTRVEKWPDQLERDFGSMGYEEEKLAKGPLVQRYIDLHKFRGVQEIQKKKNLKKGDASKETRYVKLYRCFGLPGGRGRPAKTHSAEVTRWHRAGGDIRGRWRLARKGDPRTRMGDLNKACTGEKEKK